MGMEKLPDAPNSNRRDFVKKASAVALGGISALVPVAAGVQVLFDPLHRKSELGAAVRVTNLESLPPDGVPRKFTIVATRFDAWNRYPNVPIGAIYLRRPEANKVEAL